GTDPIGTREAVEHVAESRHPELWRHGSFHRQGLEVASQLPTPLFAIAAAQIEIGAVGWHAWRAGPGVQQHDRATVLRQGKGCTGPRGTAANDEHIAGAGRSHRVRATRMASGRRTRTRNSPSIALAQSASAATRPPSPSPR